MPTGFARTATDCRRSRVAFRWVVMDQASYLRGRFTTWYSPVALFTMRGDAQDFINRQPKAIRDYLSIRDLKAE